MTALPLSWRLVDALEAVRAAVWPRRARRATGYAFLVPAVLLVGLLVAGLVYIADDSLRVLDPATYRLGSAHSLANYAEIARRPVYLLILWRSVLAAFIVTAATLLLAFPYAYVMVRTGSAGWRKFLLISLFLPFFIGQVVRAYGWLILLGQQGMINTALGALGIGPLKLIYTYPTVIVGLIQYMLPFAVLLLAPAVTAIPEEVEQASGGLGARWWQTLGRVVLPLARPGLVGAAIVVFTLSLTDYAMPDILGGGGNDFIANAVYDGFFQISDAGLGSALAILVVLIGSACVGIMLALCGAGGLGFLKTGS